MSKTTEQKLARAIQSETGATYSTSLRAVRESRSGVADGPDFTERWKSAALNRMPGAMPKT